MKLMSQIIIVALVACGAESVYECYIETATYAERACSIRGVTVNESRPQIEITAPPIAKKWKIDEIKWVLFGKAKFSSSPREILYAFNGLKRVDIESSTGLHNLDDLFFREVLDTITIETTDLEVIGENAFKGLANLTLLLLNSNGINRIHKDSFKDLVKLKSLGLSFNKIASLHDDIFKKNVNLENVNLSGNQIAVITARVFASNTKLEWLNLESNKIRKIEEDFTKNLCVLKEIDLTGNLCTDSRIEIDDTPELELALGECFNNYIVNATRKHVNQPY